MRRRSPLFGWLRGASIEVWLAAVAVPITVITLVAVAPGKDFEQEIVAGAAQVGWVAMAGMLAGMAGMTWSFSRLELWRSGLDWHLPGLRRWLLAEELLVGGVIAVLSGAWIVVLHSHGSLPIRLGVGVAFALACFALGGLGSDVSVPGWLRFAGGLSLYAFIFRAAEIENTLLAVPPVTVALCGTVTAVLWWRRLDRRVARRRLHAFRASLRSEGTDQWRRLKGPSGHWDVPLTSERLLPWLRAAVYEGGGGFPAGPLGFIGFNALVIAVVLQYLGSDFMEFTLIGMIVLATTVFPFRLVSGLVYPLSRLRRGQLVVVGALLTEVAFVGLSAVFLMLIKASPLADVWHSAGPRETIPWPVVLLVAFAWMPVVSWGSVQAAAGAWRAGRNVLTAALVPFLLYLVPVGLTLGPFGEWWREGERALVVALVVMISAVCRVVLWWATQRHFARADLSPVISN